MSSIRTHSTEGVYGREGGSSQCSRYLHALFAEAPSDSFIELRLRTAFGMRSVHLAADGIRAAADIVATHSSLTDVYVGVLPRVRRGGKRDDLVPAGMVLWADCDTTSSLAKLRSVVRQPSVTVASGTRGNLHAYWLLGEPVSTTSLRPPTGVSRRCWAPTQRRLTRRASCGRHHSATSTDARGPYA